MALVLVAAAAIATAQEKNQPSLPENWKFTLPEGDAEQGKATFMKMRCFTCHVVRVPGEETTTVGKAPGPVLGPGYAELPAEYLAESIIRAHKTVAAPGYQARKDVAGMGNYNYFLTLEELIDLVAFMKTLSAAR
jgi:hypothetical protein